MSNIDDKQPSFAGQGARDGNSSRSGSTPLPAFILPRGANKAEAAIVRAAASTCNVLNVVNPLFYSCVSDRGKGLRDAAVSCSQVSPRIGKPELQRLLLVTGREGGTPSNNPSPNRWFTDVMELDEADTGSSSNSDLRSVQSCGGAERSQRTLGHYSLSRVVAASRLKSSGACHVVFPDLLCGRDTGLLLNEVSS